MSVPKAAYFEFTTADADWDTGELIFRYKTVLENGSEMLFEEHLHVETPVDLSRAQSAPVIKTLEALHLVLGVSYYKLHAAEEIRHPYPMSLQEADFWNLLYIDGLGEFYYLNKLDFRERIQFAYDQSVHNEITDDLQIEDKALILHGGGKDSIVSAEIIKKTGAAFDLFAVSPKDIQKAVADTMGKELYSMERTLDKTMLDLSKSDAVHIGHIPISSIYAFTALLHALLHGHQYIIASNERSSDYGNIRYKGLEINHQWSKTLEFENAFRMYVESYITQNISYFSLLRPIYEIAVVKLFSKYDTYFTVFSSSNHSFKVTGQNSSARWDVDYSKGKVEFVWTLMSAFIDAETLFTIFDDDLYSREDRMPVFRKLLGVEGVKPLDCVGTPDEMKAAMYLASQKGHFADTPVMKYFEQVILPSIDDPESLLRKTMTYDDDTNIPQHMSAALKAALGNV